MTREMGGLLSSRSAKWRAQRQEAQEADAKLKIHDRTKELEQLWKKRAKALVDFKRQLVELEEAQKDKDWDAMSDEDERRMLALADLRHKIAELEQSDCSVPWRETAS